MLSTLNLYPDNKHRRGALVRYKIGNSVEIRFLSCEAAESALHNFLLPNLFCLCQTLLNGHT